MHPSSADAAAWATWARGDVESAVHHALDRPRDHPDAEQMLRLACVFALRGHRVDLLEARLDDIRRLERSVERDAVLATVRLGAGDLYGAVALALADPDAELVEPDPRLTSAVSLRAATIVHVGLGALASAAWMTARECVDAANAVLASAPENPADEQARFDLLGMAAVVEAHTTGEEREYRSLVAALAPLRARNLLTTRHALAVLCLADVEHLRGDLGRAAVNALRGARLAGDLRPGFIAHARILLAFIRIRQGRWADAAQAVEALDDPDKTVERDWIQTQVLAVRGLLLAVDGDVAASVAALAQARRMAERTPSYLAAIVLLHAQITGAIAAGDWRGLHRALDDAEEPGYRHPYRPGEWNALRLLAVWHLGDVAGSRRMLAEWAARSDAASDPYYWAFAAIIAESDRRFTEGMAAIERALTTLRHDDDPLGRAWVRMVAGTYFARYGADGAPDPSRALAAYDEALAELRELGAHAFAARCEAIIADSVAALDRTRRSEPASALTDQQQRIARAVAQGYTSDEIAAIEYLSKRTIDYHVANILRRLGVTSRREIARVLAGDDPRARTDS